MTITIIVIIYFAALLVLALKSNKQVKDSKDFIIAGRSGSELDITGSLLATVVGSSAILGTLNLTVSQGWAAMWFLFSASLGLWFLVPKAEAIYSHDKFTLPQLFGRFYGESAKKISSIIIPIAWVGIVAAQLVGAAKILVTLLGIGYEFAVIVAGVILIVYTVLGGQISILKTDKLQAFLIYFGIFILAISLFVKDTSVPFSTLSESFPFNQTFKISDLVILLLTYSTTFLVGPDIYSRIFSASSASIGKKSVRNVALMLIPFSIALCYVGMYINGLDLPMNSKGINFMEFLKFNTSTVMFAICSLALLSAVLSSADTTLLSASIILMDFKDRRKDRMLYVTRVLVLVLGVFSVLIALKISSIISILLTSLSFYSGAFVLPMVIALFSKMKPKGSANIAMITGGLTALIGKVLVNQGWEYGNLIIILAFVLNGFCLFFVGRSHVDHTN
ncbi:sodium:solute symporter family protein [Halosquirtibacter xylanolyticus]|uniref:sodium:solute symporter family protein n=1 Tax=Halosquirtibacter xylanolyticus TaxID=3374599 RepID=UPI00374940B1|nr:sodium:solute symporter family protein [Prolixibacteraceae bacterium]